MKTNDTHGRKDRCCERFGRISMYMIGMKMHITTPTPLQGSFPSPSPLSASFPITLGIVISIYYPNSTTSFDLPSRERFSTSSRFILERDPARYKPHLIRIQGGKQLIVLVSLSELNRRI